MSFFEELKRRNVVRVGIAYGVATWILLQLTDVLSEILVLPEWVPKLILLILLVGFIPALIFAWAFEMTPEGIKRENEVDRTQSTTGQTSRKLDFVIIGMLALGLAYFIWEARFKENEPASGSAELSQPATQGVSAETTGAQSINPNSIAVLPFANRSSQADDEFFSDGIHDDLLTQLAKIGDLKVISRTSVMEYRDTTKKIPEIAAELGVTKILEGGVQRAGKRIRINAQLIDVATDEHLWAETFDREMTMDNIFEIQSEITRQIVTAVKGELTLEEQQSISQRPTDNLEAWEAYLHMKSLLRGADYSAQKYIEAEPWAQKAVDLDPNFAEARAALAEVQLQGIWIGFANTPEQYEKVRRNLARAVELAPESADVIAAQAEYQYRIEIDYPAAHELYMKALAKAPGDADVLHYKAVTERRLGLWEQSITSFEKALEVDPLNAFAAMTMIETLGIMNAWDRMEYLADRWLLRYPESGGLTAQKISARINGYGDMKGARALLDTVTDSTANAKINAEEIVLRYDRDWQQLIDFLDDNDNANRLFIFNEPDLGKGEAYLLMGEPETAKFWLDKHIRETQALNPQGLIAEAFKLSTLARGYALLGEIGLAKSYIAQAAEMLPIERDHLFGGNMDRQRVWVQALVGDRDEALQRLESRLGQPGGYTKWELYLDPRWDFFRDDERFNALVQPDNLQAKSEPARRIGDGT